MIEAYWRQVGGTLVAEFPVVARGADHGPRWIDAVILPGGPFERSTAELVALTGQDVIVVQAKRDRLGMYLMGQVLFSQVLVWERFRPKSVRSIALCEQDDAVLRPLLERHPGIEVVVLEKPSS